MMLKLLSLLFQPRILIAFALFVLVVLLVAQITFVGPDYYHIYYATARNWLEGERPLYGDAYYDFYNAPWLLFGLLPFGLLSITLGQAMWHGVSVVALVLSIHVYTRPKTSLLAIVLTVINLFTIDMILRGQIDAFILGGVILGWWAIRQRQAYLLGLAMMIMAMKPPNLLLVFVLFALTIREWSPKELVKVLSVPIVITIFTTLIIGLDWPVHYIDHYQSNPLIDYLSITLWRGLNIIGVSHWPFVLVAIISTLMFVRVAWRDGLSGRTLSLALTTNLVFTGYANGNHYVMLIPAFLCIYEKNWRYALLVYLFSWTPLLRASMGFEAAVFDLGYALLLWVGAWLHLDSQPQLRTDAESTKVTS